GGAGGGWRGNGGGGRGGGGGRFGRGRGGGHTATSSSRPRLPGGLVSWRWRSAATAAALRSPGGKSRQAARSSSSDEKSGDSIAVPAFLIPAPERCSCCERGMSC